MSAYSAYQEMTPVRESLSPHEELRKLYAAEATDFREAMRFRCSTKAPVTVNIDIGRD
jgi:hypothetical protein